MKPGAIQIANSAFCFVRPRIIGDLGRTSGYQENEDEQRMNPVGHDRST